MEIVRGMCGGAFICFSIGTLENGQIHDAEMISIEEEDFFFIRFVVMKHYPSFDIYDLVNPISASKLRQFIWELEAILKWMKTGELHEFISYYAEWLSTEKGIPSIEERIAFFEELVEYFHNLEQYDFDYLNLAGF